MSQSTDTQCPRIYVACLAAYNQGHLHGTWIDADQDADAIHEEIQQMLAESPVPDAEEWAIHDYEGFGGLNLSEYEDIERVAEFGQLLAEHGPAFGAYAGHVGADYATAFAEPLKDAHELSRHPAALASHDIAGQVATLVDAIRGRSGVRLAH